MPPSERTRYEREMEMVRTELGISELPDERGQAFERACAKGHATTSEQVVNCVLEEAAGNTLN